MRDFIQGEKTWDDDFQQLVEVIKKNNKSTV